MSDRFASRADVAAKVDWEGGVVAALEYGVKAAHMPEDDPDLTEAWSVLETSWELIEPIILKIEDMLDEALQADEAAEAAAS